jgi:hypothetical protein
MLFFKRSLAALLFCAPRLFALANESLGKFNVLPITITLCCGLIAFGCPAFAAICPESGALELKLVVAPGELAGARTALSISMYADGCVALELPAHRIDHGQFRLQLQPEELAQLRLRVAPLARLSQAALDSSIAATAQRSAASGELFAVHDADLITLALNASGTLQVLRASGLKQLAERYPENSEIAELARLIAQLEQLIANPKRVRVSTEATL